MHDFWHVQDIDLFEQLDVPERDSLRRLATIRRYGVGQTVFTPTPTPRSVYLLESGCVRIYRLSNEGNETTFGYVAPGEVFGELSSFGDFQRESFAQASEESRVWEIPAPDFRRFIEEHPKVAFTITKQMGARFKSIESRVENLVFRDVRCRVAAILLELGARLGREEGGALRIELPLTQAELATLVGATRQSVNESLREFSERGWVQRDQGQLVVAVPAGLQGYLDQRDAEAHAVAD